MENYMDKTLSPELRAADLLARLTIQEKLAQLAGAWLPHGDFDGFVAKVQHGIGQISTLSMREMTSIEEVVWHQHKAQELVMKQSRFGIPAVFHMEGLCGPFIQGGTSFPSGIGRASSWNPALEEEVGHTVARQERAVGITQTFAPVLDISRDSRMGRQGETYGEDPTLAATMGAAYVRGVQAGETEGRRSESVAKHFMGFHNSQGGIHGTHCDMDRRMLTEIYGKPFQAAIAESNMRGVMPCYNDMLGEPVSASKAILTEMLRTEMGFDGVVVSDYGAVGNIHNIQKVEETLHEAGYRSLCAGMDVELPQQEAFNGKLAAMFENGEADISVLDAAVLRVLRAKFRMGIFEHPYALKGAELEKAFHNLRDKDISLESAKESMVLLKNNGVLPLKNDVKKIALIGCHANNARSFFGGYTHLSMEEAVHAVANSLAGVQASGKVNAEQVKYVHGTQIQCDETDEFDALLRQIHPGCQSLLQGMRIEFANADVQYAYGYPIAGDDTSHFAEALAIAKDADIVVLTLGGKHGSCSVASMGEGVDSTDINLPYCQDEFIKQVAMLGKPVVGVHFDGRPISSDVADAHLDAILEAWNPSEMGAQAIAETLSGKNNPSGKMPVSVARCAGQVPVYYNHYNGSSYHQGGSIGFQDYVNMPHTPRYFFGHGLSYTSFAYSNLQMDSREVAPDTSVSISLQVQNTGSTTGTEIVQMYLKDRFASMMRPVMELAGYARVTLNANETKTVTFTVRPSLMAFLDVNMEWRIEKGEIDVLIGSSSSDIRVEDSFQITQTEIIVGKERSFYAKGSIE